MLLVVKALLKRLPQVAADYERSASTLSSHNHEAAEEAVRVISRENIDTLGRQHQQTMCLLRRRILAILLSFSVLLPLAAIEPEWDGEVLEVHDGDTAWMMLEGARVKVRVHGIDSPEIDQEAGPEATEYASGLVLGTVVHAKQVDTDKYGRLVVKLTLPDGRFFDQEMVRAGFAWWYQAYAPEDRTLQALEQEARVAKRGLWADPNPTPPWTWRHRKDVSPDPTPEVSALTGRPAWMRQESQKKERPWSHRSRTKAHLKRSEKRSER